MKKRKTLLIQVGLIIAAFFAALVVAVGTLVYAGTSSIFLNAKNEMIDRDLLRVKKLVEDIQLLPSLIDYWKDHTEDIKRDLTQEEYQAGYKVYEDTGFEPTKEYFDASDDASKLVIAQDNYSYLSVNLNEEQYKFNYTDIYLVDISEENCGYVICHGNGDVIIDRSSLGEQMKIDISGHRALQKIRSGQYNKTEYEIIDNVNGDSYYVGYAPIEINGIPKYAVCILYDWSTFRTVLTENLTVMLIVGLTVMAAAGCLLLHYLYRTAIKPVTAIQATVREYIDSKDSVAVAENMDRITQSNEFGALAGDISKLAKEIDRYTKENVKLAGEQQRVATELDLASRIQNGSLPSTFPAYPERSEFDIYASMTPAKEVGGDFYDHFFIDDDHLALVIADVSGKGVPASLFMMSSKILINDRTILGGDPAEVLGFVNERICKRNLLDMFVTVWLGILEISTGKLTCTNAGHEYPIIGSGGRFELLKDKHSMAVGAVPGVKYKSYELQLNKGDTVFVYTDGAAEATNASEEMFGADRITQALNTVPDGSPQELIGTVTKAVNDFVKDAPQFDDLTMLCLKYMGK